MLRKLQCNQSALAHVYWLKIKTQQTTQHCVCVLCSSFIHHMHIFLLYILQLDEYDVVDEFIFL